MAEKDKVRFDAEKKHHDIMEPKGGRGTKRKPMKDPNAPKRPLSGFFLWVLQRMQLAEIPFGESYLLRAHGARKQP